MRWFYKLPLRFRSLFRKRRIEQELSDELRFHLEKLAEANTAKGMTEEEARYAALRELGGVEQIKEECRDMRRMNFIETFLQDLRYGARQLRRNPGFTAVAVITLALGIGATTAIFSVVYGVLLRPLPYPHPDQIVSLTELARDGHHMRFADPNFHDLRAMNQTLAAMAKGYSDEMTIASGSGPARVSVATVSADFLRVMGVAPMLGRGFVPDELHEGGTPAALASYGYWKQNLGGSTDLSTIKLKTEDHVFSVVGVMPPGFDYPGHTQLWLPAELFGDQSPSRTSHNWGLVVGRLRSGVSLAQARANLSALARELYQQYKPNIDMTDVSVSPLRQALTASVRPALLVLLGAVGFLLLVGCANVANLLLARAAARERELAIRAALGAGRFRLIRQFMTETSLLSLAGGAIAVLLAIGGVDALLALAPRNLPRLDEVSVNLPVLLFALGISALVAMGLGVVTAMRATAADPQDALAEGGRGFAGSLASRRLARLLIGSQVAVTLVLLAGAGLLGRSLLRVLSVDPGFRTTNIVTMELEVPASQLETLSTITEAIKDTKPASFMNDLFNRLGAIAGVKEVGGVSNLPLGQGGDCPDGKFLLLNQAPRFDVNKPEDLASLDRLWNTAPGGGADFCVASAGYFKALGIPLLRGRLFNEHDTADAPHAALVSESMAHATWPNQNPLGRTIEFGNMDGDMRLLTIVGVVGDVHQRSLEKSAEPTVYVNYRQRLRGDRDFTVVMRATAPPRIVLDNARRILRQLAPDIAPRFQAFPDVFSASLDVRRFNLTLIAVFAIAALSLAAVGIYGVIAYSVSQRTHEIGIRMALGANKTDVLRMIAGQGLKMTIAGVVLGIAGALALTRFLASQLYGVTPNDPLTFIAVALLLASVALLASYLPARRATRVDPMAALRHE